MSYKPNWFDTSQSIEPSVTLNVKKQIIKLRSEGKSYNEIVALLGCSKSTVAYHSCEKTRANNNSRQRQRRYAFFIQLKKEAGGRCSKCGYNRCWAALDFHHTNENKQLAVSAFWKIGNKQQTLEEAKKCILLCANCHREFHHPNGMEQHVGNAPT